MVERNRIRELRVERGISQEELADLLGITQATVSKIEGGEPLQWYYLGALCKFLDVRPRALYVSDQELEAA